MIQRELDELKERFNNRKTRKDAKKLLPSGVSPNHAMALWHTYPDARWCLIPVNIGLVSDMMNSLFPRGSPLEDWGVPLGFAERASEALASLSLNLSDVTTANGWTVFQSLVNVLL